MASKGKYDGMRWFRPGSHGRPEFEVRGEIAYSYDIDQLPTFVIDDDKVFRLGMCSVPVYLISGRLLYEPAGRDVAIYELR